MSALRIVPMESAHVEAAAELGRICFSLPWSEAGFAAEIASERCVCLTALAGGELAGFICGGTVLDEAEVELLAVSPPFRRQGAASALLSRFLEACRERKIAVVHLEVRASNAGAAALYERFGFVRDGVRKNYYRRPAEDAILYSLGMGGGLLPPKPPILL